MQLKLSDSDFNAQKVCYLSDQILVINQAEVSPCSLGNPLPCHQVSHHDRSRTYTNYKTKQGEKKDEKNFFK